MKTALPITLLCLLSFQTFARHTHTNRDSRIVVNEETTASSADVANTALTLPPFSWSVDRKLTWDDFNGIAHTSDDNTAAATYCGIGFESKTAESSAVPEIKVYNKFFPSKSWVRPGQLKSGILAHEQCHFDICELYTRILRHRLAIAVASKNVTADVLNAIYNEVQDEYTAFQEQYEQETAHGTIHDAQQIWEYKIAEELNKISVQSY